MSNMMDMMVLFNIFIAVYVLFYAIKGTGKIYENDYPKAMKEEHAKFLRKFCWIIGVGLLILSVLEYWDMTQNPSDSGFNIFSIISIVYALGCIVWYFVVFRIKFKEYLGSNKPQKK